MAQFVLRYNGSALIPAVSLDSIRSTPGVQVLDESAKMMLVSGEESTLRETLLAKLGFCRMDAGRRRRR
jgi:hypothetical protein